MSWIGLEPLRPGDEPDPAFSEQVAKVNVKRDRYLKRERARDENKKKKVKTKSQKKDYRHLFDPKPEKPKAEKTKAEKPKKTKKRKIIRTDKPIEDGESQQFMNADDRVDEDSEFFFSSETEDPNCSECSDEEKVNSPEGSD